MLKRLDRRVQAIIALNHAWKRQREILESNHPVALMLQSHKSSMQASLIRDFPGELYLRLDTENTEGEALYSVRLRQPIKLPSGGIREDAEHLPVRLAKALFTVQELKENVST